MSYRKSIADRLPEGLKQFAGTVETWMYLSHRTLDGVPAETFDAYCAEAVQRGSRGMAHVRDVLVSDGEMAADY